MNPTEIKEEILNLEAMGVQTKGNPSFTPSTCSSHAITGSRLRVLIINAHRLLGRKYRGSPLWSLVSDLTGHGCTVSTEICQSVNLAPCQPCGGKELRESNDAN